MGDTGTEYVRSRKKLEGSMGDTERSKKRAKKGRPVVKDKVSTGPLMENTGKCMGDTGRSRESTGRFMGDTATFMKNTERSGIGDLRI
jgi:hypothetical protein